MTTPEDAPKLARQTGEEGGGLKAPPQTSVPKAEPDTSSALEAPPFLHEREINDAVRVVNLIASGRNPFSDEPFEKLRPDQRDTVLQALCVVVAALAQAERITVPVPKLKPLSLLRAPESELCLSRALILPTPSNSGRRSLVSL